MCWLTRLKEFLKTGVVPELNGGGGGGGGVGSVF